MKSDSINARPIAETAAPSVRPTPLGAALVAAAIAIPVGIILIIGELMLG